MELNLQERLPSTIVDRMILSRAESVTACFTSPRLTDHTVHYHLASAIAGNLTEDTDFSRAGGLRSLASATIIGASAASPISVEQFIAERSAAILDNIRAKRSEAQSRASAASSTQAKRVAEGGGQRKLSGKAIY